MKAALLSIRPEYTEKIFRGQKKVELRRTRLSLVAGDSIYIYASSPIKALVGVIEVEEIISGAPYEIWHAVESFAGVSKTTFDEYFAGTEEAFGIFFTSARPLPTPLELAYLREVWTGFHPPQAYRYLSQSEVHFLSELSHVRRKKQLLNHMPSCSGLSKHQLFSERM